MDNPTPARIRVWTYVTPEERKQFRIRMLQLETTPAIFLRNIILQYLEQADITFVPERIPRVSGNFAVISTYITPEENKALKIKLIAISCSVSKFLRSLIIQFLSTPLPKHGEQEQKEGGEEHGS